MLNQERNCILKWNIHPFTQQVLTLGRDCATYLVYNRDFMETATKGITEKSQYL